MPPATLVTFDGPEVFPAAAPPDNRLLRGLPQEESGSLMRLLQPVELRAGEVLAEPGERIAHVYFPVDCCFSLMANLGAHPALGVGLAGREGMLGSSLALGIATAPLRASVQGAGTALRMEAAPFRRALAQCPGLRRNVGCYMHVQLMLLAQTAYCVRFHVIEARLAQWLLMAHDRSAGDSFAATHAALAALLGVRRSGVTTAAGALHRKSLIEYNRGRVTVLNRRDLERRSCGCYRIARGIYDGLLAP